MKGLVRSKMISAHAKKEELVESARKKAAYDALPYSEKREIERVEWIKQAKIWMADEIYSATSFPHLIKPHSRLWDFRIEELTTWMEMYGYSLEMKWHDGGNGDFIDEITIDLLEDST